MMAIQVSDLVKLQAWDTPTICNALDVAAPDRRAIGFTTRPLVPVGIHGSVCGYVKTAKISGKNKPLDNATEIRTSYYKYISEKLKPSIVLIEDIDITFNTNKTGEIRNKAIGLAESNGLSRLAQKILTTEDFKKFQKKNDIDVNYIVESIEFSNEILSDNYYKASINIKFNPYRTREFFRENNFNFSEMQSNPIPFYAVLANHEQYFIVNNEWEKRWKELILTNDTLNLEFMLLNVPVISTGMTSTRGIGLIKEVKNINEYKKVLIDQNYNFRKFLVRDRKKLMIFAYFWFIKKDLIWNKKNYYTHSINRFRGFNFKSLNDCNFSDTQTNSIVKFLSKGKQLF